jgi:DNA polymerase-3 subunit gamma/tau
LSYQVLARKYRPINFDQVVGQDHVVRTLQNAIQQDRIAHAYIFHGIRGTGKTTLARIMARALNCTGGEDADKPSINPCGECDDCAALANDRHVDVIEIDAASQNSVDDIRELIDSLKYAPVTGRYKVYIVDEVHMLSDSAFNALLKSLEEPPEHVVFMFATTEIRKIPVTVLSRCQRFDLKRVSHNDLADYYKDIIGREDHDIADQAMRIITRSADGSVRDGLSLLDQAIAITDDKIGVEDVRRMLGLADRDQIIDLFKAIMAGKSENALESVKNLHDYGGDPVTILRDLAEFTHAITRAKIVRDPDLLDQYSQNQREAIDNLSARLTMPVLTRAWQMMTADLSNLRQSPTPFQALEMAVIKLLFAAELPPPEKMLDSLEKAKQTAQEKSAKQPTDSQKKSLKTG